MFGTVFKIIHIRCSFLSKSATVITKGAKILWKWHIFKLRLLALYWTCLCETTTSNTKRTWIFWTGTNYFCPLSICGAKLKKLRRVESTLLWHLGLFLKAGGMNQKKEKCCYFPLEGGQNGTPVLGLCHFISEKNVVQAPRVFTVNSYIELYTIICGIL